MARKQAPKKEEKPRCKADQWLTPNGLLMIGAWARDGATDEELAKLMKISRSTLSEWKKRYEDIKTVLEDGKEVVDIKVENALLKNALAGDFKAQKYWLNNRKPHLWKDVREEDKQPDGTINVVYADEVPEEYGK
jgi:hypothetical protein